MTTDTRKAFEGDSMIEIVGFSMARDARCCTAQPNLANFLVGADDPVGEVVASTLDVTGLVVEDVRG